MMGRLSLLLVISVGLWASVQSTTTLQLLGTAKVPTFHDGGLTFGPGTEQVTFDDKEKIAYMIGNTQLYIIDVSAALLLGGAGVAQLPTLKAVDLGAPVNDVYFCGGYVAVAVNGASKNLPGFVAIYGRFVRGQPFLELTRIGVGYLPDQLEFSKDCKTLLVSNEAEPISYGNPSLVNDPEGSVSVINLYYCDEEEHHHHHHRGHYGPYSEAQAESLNGTTASADGHHGYYNRKTGYPYPGYKHDKHHEYEKDSDYHDDEPDCSTARVLGKVRTATFTAWNNKRSQLTAQGVKLTGNGTVAQDLEPEYATFAENEDIAFVALQENNALAVLNVKTAKIVNVFGLGFKNHSRFPLDVSDRDNMANIANWPVFGMYQPDEIRSFRFRGADYIVAANEGDARDWAGLKEESRVSAIAGLLDTSIFNVTYLNKPENLGRLNVLTVNGKPYAPFSDPTNTGKFQKLFSFGARSFTIWKLDQHGSLADREIRLVYDSKDDLEAISKAQLIDRWNSDLVNLNNGSWDSRSDNKGPEPEGMDIGPCAGYKHHGRTYSYGGHDDYYDEEERLCLFLGTERLGVIYVYDISNPASPKFFDVVRPPQSNVTDALTRFSAPEGVAYEEYTNGDDKHSMVFVAYEADTDDPKLPSGLGVFKVVKA